MGIIESFVSSTGLKQHENIAYGRLGGIYYSLVFNRMYANVTVTAFVTRPQGILSDEIAQFIKAKGKQHKAKFIGVEGNAVTVLLNSEVKRIKAQNAVDFLTAFSAFLTEKGYVSSCTACGKQANLIHVYRNGTVKEVCESCYENIAVATTQIKAQRETTGSYLGGTAGAVLGGIIGIIPWVVLAMIGFISALSGLIMAFLSFKGYLLLKGKQSRGMLFIIIAVLIVFTYVGVLTSEAVGGYQMLAEEGYDVAFTDILGLAMALPFIGEASEAGPLWAQIALGWFFAGLGSFGYLAKIKKQSSGEDLEVRRLQ